MQKMVPRTPGGEEYDDVTALCNRVFRPDGWADMRAQYPLVLRRDNIEQLRILSENGKPVSLVCMVEGNAALLGCAVRIALIGLVCTGQECQGRGLAGVLMDDAVERATAMGYGMMLISGGRTLYTRRGSHYVGDFVKYEADPARLPCADGLTISQMTPERAGDAWPLLEAEPIRFRRTPEDYAKLLATDWVVGYPGSTWLVERTGRAVAVFSINHKRLTDSSKIEAFGVREMGGSRQAALAAVGELARRFGTKQVEWDGCGRDAALADAFAAIGVKPDRAAHYGTVKLLSVERLMNEFKPLLCERLGEKTAAALTITSQIDGGTVRRVAFELGNERLMVEGEVEVLAALFGAPEIDPLAAAPEKLGKVLRLALPLPLPLYGLNYV
ncbi:GNAT family N-acetyltransferase [bacterium]|nr:GNAT family N-acetyltransferase [bacterium]